MDNYPVGFIPDTPQGFVPDAPAGVPLQTRIAQTLEPLSIHGLINQPARLFNWGSYLASGGKGYQLPEITLPNLMPNLQGILQPSPGENVTPENLAALSRMQARGAGGDAALPYGAVGSINPLYAPLVPTTPDVRIPSYQAPQPLSPGMQKAVDITGAAVAPVGQLISQIPSLETAPLLMTGPVGNAIRLSQAVVAAGQIPELQRQAEETVRQDPTVANLVGGEANVLANALLARGLAEPVGPRPTGARPTEQIMPTLTETKAAQAGRFMPKEFYQTFPGGQAKYNVVDLPPEDVSVKMTSGFDPKEVLKMLRPAVQLGGKLLVGEQGDTHADILKRAGISPEEINHYNPARGFELNGKFVTRKEAESLTQTPGTAKAGGTDSMDLPGAKYEIPTEAFFEEPQQQVPITQKGEYAVRKLRPDSLLETQPPGGIQKVEEKVRGGTEAEGVAQKEGQKVAKPYTPEELTKAEWWRGGEQRFIFGPSRVGREIESRLQESAIKEPVYHLTRRDYERADPQAAQGAGSQFGMHFGTAKAAKDRGEYGVFGEGLRTSKYFVDIRNPIRVTDAEANHVGPLIEKLKRTGLMTRQESDYLISVRSSEERAKFLVDLLKRRGYDGMVYVNDVEDKGRDSFIAFDKSQIVNAMAPKRAETGELYSGIDLGKLFPGKKQEFKYKDVLEFVGSRAGVTAPEWLKKAKVTREADYSGYAAGPDIYSKFKQQQDPYFSPESNWFRHHPDQPGVVLHKTTGKPYFAVIKPTVTGEKFLVDGKPATAEQVKDIKAFVKGGAGGGQDFRVFDLDKVEVEKGTGVKPFTEGGKRLGGQMYAGFNLTEIFGRSAQEKKNIRDVEKLVSRANLSTPAQREKAILVNPTANPMEYVAKAKQPGQDAPSRLRKAVDLARSLDTSLSPWDVIYDTLDGGRASYDGVLMNYIRHPLDKKYRQSLELRDQYIDPVRDAIKKNKMSRKDSDVIQVLLRSKTAEGVKSMQEAGVEQGVIDNIKRTATKEQRDVANMIELRTTAMQTMTGKKRTLDKFGSGAFAEYDRYIRKSAHYVHLNELVDQLRTTVNKPEFAEKYGKMGQDLILEHLDTVERQGAYTRQKFLDILRKSTSLGVIAYRIPSQFVHLANVPLAMARTGPVWWYKGLDEVFSDTGQAFLKKYFRETYERGGGELSITEVSEGQIGAEGAYRKFGKAGFAIQRAIDQYNAQATVLGVYMKELAAKGKDPSDYANLPVDERLIGKATVLARRAVASPSFKDVPPAILRGGSYTRSLMQFQNTFLDQWSNIRYDLLQAGIPEVIAGNPKVAMAALLGIAGMLLTETTIKYGYKEGKRELAGREPREDDDYWKELQREASRRIPGMGQLMAGWLYEGTGIPSVDVVLEARKQYKKGLAEADPDRQKLAFGQAAASLATAAGVPGTSQAKDIGVALAEREIYKPHTKRLQEATGKEPEEMTYPERVAAEAQYKRGLPKRSEALEAQMAASAIKSDERRGKEMFGKLDAADQNFLKSRGLELPGYSNRLQSGKTSVYLSKDEAKKFDELVHEEVTRAVNQMRNDIDFASGTSDFQTTYFHNVMRDAYKAAKNRMEAELVKPKRQRYSFMTNR